MPRIKRAYPKSSAFEYFSTSGDESQFICQCPVLPGSENLCLKRYSANRGSCCNGYPPSRTSNLKRHLKKSHPEIFEIVQQRDGQIKHISLRRKSKISPPNQLENYTPIVMIKKEPLSVFDLNVSSMLDDVKREKTNTERIEIECKPPLLQSPPPQLHSPCESPSLQKTNIFESDDNSKVTVSMSASQFKKGLMRMILHDEIPLESFSRGFADLNGEMARQFGISLQKEGIKEMIIGEANALHSRLKENLEDKFMYLKIDVCTRHKMKFVIISARYTDVSNTICTRTLAVKNVKSDQSVDDVKNIIETVLEDYAINKERILCVLTDNDSNIINLQNKMASETKENETTFEAKPLNGQRNHDDHQTSVNRGDGESKNLYFLVQEATELAELYHMPSCVYTHHLFILEGLQDYHTANLISKMSKIEAARRGRKLVMDNTSNWETTYYLTEYINELKSGLIDDLDSVASDDFLSEEEWEQAEELKEILEYLYSVTLCLQEEESSPGMFLKEWKNLEFRLSPKSGPVARGFLNALRCKEMALLENKIFQAAIYVDPMHRVLLTNVDKAKKALLNVALQVNGFIPSQTSLSSNKISSYFSHLSGEIDFETILDMEEEKSINKKISNSDNNPLQADFVEKFSSSFIEIEKFNRSSKVGVFDAISLYPETVAETASLVTALPCNAASLSRLISALKMVKSDVIDGFDILEAMIFLKTNDCY